MQRIHTFLNLTKQATNSRKLYKSFSHEYSLTIDLSRRKLCSPLSEKKNANAFFQPVNILQIIPMSINARTLFHGLGGKICKREFST